MIVSFPVAATTAMSLRHVDSSPSGRRSSAAAGGAAQQVGEKGPGRQREHLAAQVNDVPLAFQREAGDVENGEAIVSGPVAERLARQHGQAHAAGDEFADRLVARQRQPDLQLDAGVAHVLVDDVARTRSFLAQQEMLGWQLLQSQSLAGGPVHRRRQHDIFVVEEGLADDVEICGRV